MAGKSLYMASLDITASHRSTIPAFSSRWRRLQRVHELGARFTQLCLFVSGHVSCMTVRNILQVRRKKRKIK